MYGSLLIIQMIGTLEVRIQFKYSIQLIRLTGFL